MNLSVLLLFIVVPAAIGVLLLLVKNTTARKAIVYPASVAIIAGSVWLLFANFSAVAEPEFWGVEAMNWLTLVFGAVIAVYLLVRSIMEKKWLVTLLVLLQAVPLIFLETAHHFKLAVIPQITVENALYFDKFSLIMALIIGIIGTLICVYSLGYMDEFHHHHKEMKDKRRSFFFILFVFLGAMFGIVFSNSLLWIYFFWEVTTLSSFLLIRYTGTEEAIKNAYKALLFNLLGGLAFAGAIFWMYFNAGTIELDKMFILQKSVVLIPAVLLAFAGMTKSAQMPFSGWLLGAMVAPTPVSALLHSSTMVKAGVFIIIKMSPILVNTYAGMIIAFIGMATFLFTSLLAISQRNAKRVLAYSTIANLGLIVACGGIGTEQATWAAILLIIFHAVAKGLLFITVGTIEHKNGSRDIEDMGSLIVKMPTLAIFMVIGISGMFLAPFGMLISKWAVLKAFIDTNPILAVVLAFGSAATLFFWTKWLGKLLGVTNAEKKGEETVTVHEWSALYPLAIGTIAVTAVFPFISKALIEPWINGIYQQVLGNAKPVGLGESNLMIMLIMLGIMLILPLGLVYYRASRSKAKLSEMYLAGANVHGTEKYKGSIDIVYQNETKNYYLENYVGEKRLFPAAVTTAIILLAILTGVLAIWRN